jgi:hypothetical protein
VLERHVDAGFVPGAVAVVARHGEVHIEATRNLAFEGAGSGTPMAADTICPHRLDYKADYRRLRDDARRGLHDAPRRPVDEFLPELADMRVLADPDGPITDALNALQSEEPPASSCETVMPADKWIRRLGKLPLFYQPGERWMYNTAANVTGVLIARATSMSFGDALCERLCGPLGMKDTGFSVGGESISRLATVYQRDDAHRRDCHLGRQRRAVEPAVGVRRWRRRARLDRQRLPRLRLGPARGRYPPRRA